MASILEEALLKNSISPNDRSHSLSMSRFRGLWEFAEFGTTESEKFVLDLLIQKF